MGRCISSLTYSGAKLLAQHGQRIDFWTMQDQILNNITVVTDGHHRLDGLLQYFGNQIQFLVLNLMIPVYYLICVTFDQHR